MIKISTDNKLLDINFIHRFLSRSYWAKNRTLEEVKESIDNSVCFGVYLKNKQIGFARIVTDKIVFSYLMDVFIDESYQRKTYGEKLINEIYTHPILEKVKSHFLITKDAQEFYKKFGFRQFKNSDKVIMKK
jgi:N-acetylglutamate synthase-like GNAT family acetyltransferase